MKVRPGGPACRATETYDGTGAHPFVLFDHDLGKVAVERLQAILMSDYDEVAIGLVTMGDTDSAVKGGIDRRPDIQRQVDTHVASAMPVAEFRIYLRLIRTTVAAERIDNPECNLRRQGLIRYFVRIWQSMFPGLVEDSVVLRPGRILDVLPGVVRKKKDLHGRIGRGQCVHGNLAGQIHRLHRLKHRAGKDEFCLFLGLDE